KIVKLDRILLLRIARIKVCRCVIEPTVGIQCRVPKILEHATVERVAATARYKVDLHARLPETLIHVELLSLDRHLLDAFQPWSHGRLGVPSEFHAAGTADDAVNIVSLINRRKSVPRATVLSAGVSGN